MTAPQRIQLTRAKSWRKPETAVVVARPTIFGNPWVIGDAQGGGLPPMNAVTAVALYRKWLTSPPDREVHPQKRARILAGLQMLTGRDLACWCPLNQPCHADVLLDLANQ